MIIIFKLGGLLLINANVFMVSIQSLYALYMRGVEMHRNTLVWVVSKNVVFLIITVFREHIRAKNLRCIKL